MGNKIKQAVPSFEKKLFVLEYQKKNSVKKFALDFEISKTTSIVKNCNKNKMN